MLCHILVQTCTAPVDEARAADVVLADRYVVPLVHVSSVDTTLNAVSISAAAQPQQPAYVSGSHGTVQSQQPDWSEFTSPVVEAGKQPHTWVPVQTLASDGLESAAAAVSFAQLLSLCTEGPETRALADKAVEVG
jgi:hypothetical protein